jgi:uncharacterized phage protein (TIGR02218 family)
MPRAASPALILALASGYYDVSRADLFTFTLSDGVTTYNWTSWPADLVVLGTTYTSHTPFLKRSKWNVVNKMQVPELDVELYADNTAFNGGANIKTQIHNGLFDGATFLLQTLFMPTPGDTTTFGPVSMFAGVVGGPTVEGNVVKLPIKGKNNLLDQNAPRSTYQVGCNHAFCDAGCTLLRATYTATYAVGTSPAPSNIFLPWASAPANPGRYLGGTVTVTSGGAAGQRRTVAAVDSTGLWLAYPLYITPATGDAFTAFEGCDKTFNSGSVQSCTARSNTQNYDGFEYVPPPNSAY